MHTRIFGFVFFPSESLMCERSRAFTPQEVEYLTDIIGRLLQNSSKLTANKRILTKKAWNEVEAKFCKRFPHHKRKALQRKWDRLKASFAAWKTLQVPASGSDVSGQLPAEAEAERSERMVRLRSQASLVETSGCLDKISSIMEGRHATGKT